MRRRWLRRESEKAAIEKHISEKGLAEIWWTPRSRQPWTLSDNLNWIYRNDPFYTHSVQRRSLQPDAR